MLTSDLQDFSLRDKNISGLSYILNPKFVLETLRPLFGKNNLKNFNLNYIRYKPGINCLAKYDLTVNGQVCEFYAKAFGKDKEVKIVKSKERKIVKQHLGFGRIFIENKGIVINSFPNDNKIKFLNVLDAGKNQKELFTKLFPDIPELWKSEIQTLNYKPERRFVGLIKKKNIPQGVIKFYDRPGYSKAKKNANVFKSQKLFKIPQLTGWDNKKMILCFEWIPGKELSKFLKKDTEFVKEAIIKTAYALAELHSAKNSLFGNLRPYDELLKFKEQENLFDQICPHLRNQFQEIEKRIESFLISSLSFSSPIHGDFNPSQVIVDKKGNATFIDFDRAVLGDGRLDLGSFIASLYYLLLTKEISKNQFQKLHDLFLTSYFSKTEQKYSNLEMFVASSLFKLAHHPFRTNQQNWVIQTQQILNTVEKLIDQNSSRDSNQITLLDPPKKSTTSKINTESLLESSDKNLPFLTTSLNSNIMQYYLSQLFQSQLGKQNKIKLKSIKKIRHKPGNRCLIEYKIQITGKNVQNQEKIILGKMHSKGLDKTTIRIQKSLQKSGFDTKSTDNISIPNIIGKIPECDLWFQEKIDGIPAIDLLINGNAKKIAKKIAEAIHKVHFTNIPSKRNHTIEKELQILEERLVSVAKMNPSISNRIKRVIDKCFKLAQYINPVDSVGIHRDFYHDQVLVRNKRIFLLDFDLYCMGDPALDVGNFVAHLQELSLRKFGNAKALSDVERELVKRFLKLSGEFRRSSIEIYTILTLARHIAISQQFSERKKFTESLISLCEKRLKKQLLKMESQNEKIKPFQKIST